MEEKEVKKKPHVLKRALLSYRKIPDKKPYIEFFAALLTIPVLLTVILLNVNSLRSTNKDSKTSTTPEKIYITQPGSNTQVTAAPSQGPCKTQIGPIDITAPEEGDTVTDNPVFVEINYQQGTYCSVVWSYRINGGKWSDYNDNSIALYNPPSGNIKFELRVKSVVNSDTKTLSRNFIYKGNTIVPTSPVSSASAN